MQVLYDIGAVSTPEPFQRLVSQGMILGEVEFTVHKDADGAYVAEGTPGATTIRWAGARALACFLGWSPKGVGRWTGRASKKQSWYTLIGLCN